MISDDCCGHANAFRKIPAAVVPSTDASASTLQHRTYGLPKFAESICSRSDRAQLQLIADLKKLEQADQDTLLQEAERRPSPTTSRAGIAMKAI